MTKPQTAALELAPIEQPKPSQELATTGGSPADLMRSALQTGMTAADIRELLAVQREWEANEARKAYVAAMTAFKANPPEIVKKKLVEFETRDGDKTSYRHATLADVTSAIVNGLASHGFSHRWDIGQGDGQVTVTCVLTHRLGHSEVTVMRSVPDASGKKNAIQQVASTVTYLERYTLLAATGLATKDMDDDGRDTEPTPEEVEAQRAQDAIYDKIGLSETVAELAKVKPEIEALPAGMQRNLISSYNVKRRELLSAAK